MLTRLLYLVLGLLGIGFVIFLHELGHFAAARLLKVDVEVLSYGMGPKLVSHCGRKTEYRLSAIPFGGYCRMKGSLDLMKALRDDSRSMEKTEKGSYFGTTPVVRFFIYLAGPAANFLLAVLMLAVSAAIPVWRLSDPALVTPVAEYESVFSTGAEQGDIRKGDLLLSSGNHIFQDWQDAAAYIEERAGETIPVTVERNGKIINTELIPAWTENGYVYGITNLQEAVVGRSLSPDFLPGDRIVAVDSKDVEYTLDVYAAAAGSFTLTIERNGERLERRIEDGQLPFAWQSSLRKSAESDHPLSYGFMRAAGMSAAALKALASFVTFHLEDAMTVITGPVKAAESIGGITALAFSSSTFSGLRALLMLLSMVSVSIAVGNLLPVPTFDGGQMLISLAEIVRRKALSPRSYVLLQIAGMLIALAIMIMMYSLDIKAYFFS